MRTTPKTIIIDRLAHALGMQGVKLKRDHLITTSAYAYGYRNRETFDAAADAGELTAPPAEAIGTFDLEGGTTLVVLRDPLSGLPYAIDKGFLDDAGSERREQYGVSPYGRLLDVSKVDPTRILPITTHGATVRAGRGAVTYVATIVNDKHDLEVLTAPTWDALVVRIARLCRSCWRSDFPETAPVGDLDLIQAYFEHVGEYSSMQIFVNRGVDEAECLNVDDLRAYDERLKAESPADRGGTSVRRTTNTAAFVIGTVNDQDGEPMLWWSQEDGFGSLSDATVYGEMTGDLPDAGMNPGSVGWYQLPGMPEPSLATKSAKGPRTVEEMDIEFITNREGDGGGDEIDDLRPYLSMEEPDIGDRDDTRVALGYLARVDGKMYFAPTVNAWHDGTHEDAKEAMDAVAAIRKRVEPLIERLGGFCMYEDEAGEGRVELTLFIPTSTVTGVAPVDWSAALENLLGIGSVEPVIATFSPQASILDNCIDVDPEGDPKFDVTFEVLLMGDVAAQELEDHEADDLTDAIRAPDWIRNWSGPFAVHVEDAIRRRNA